MLGERNILETGIIILTNSGIPSQKHKILKSALFLTRIFSSKQSLGDNIILFPVQEEKIVFLHRKAETSSKLL